MDRHGSSWEGYGHFRAREDLQDDLYRLGRRATEAEVEWITGLDWQMWFRCHFGSRVGLSRGIEIWEKYLGRVERFRAFRHMIAWGVVGRREPEQPIHVHGFLGNVGGPGSLVMGVLAREWKEVTTHEPGDGYSGGDLWWEPYDPSQAPRGVRYAMEHDGERVQINLTPGLGRRNREYRKRLALGERIIGRAGQMVGHD